MEIRRLNEAAMTGSVTTLLELLQGDPLLLDKVMVAAFLPENPLHIAAMLGHVDFVKEILSRKPELARELNSQGSSPLHLASAKGHIEIVKEILRSDDPDVGCFVRDQEGRISLHLAAIKGRVEIVKEFIRAKPELTREMTDQGETILHLCVKYNQFEVFKIVEDEELLMAKDSEGNTVLHLAAAKRQIQA
ncbi:Ankyrin repeat [Macleaya cordata]|uniref:Ankyrin repeat n=1 Tax=Macleaya cordata TaxID=56857 RepID=A0A200QSC6_MACCD|nr:Ankyrin repeat [Macleaya cordata]